MAHSADPLLLLDTCGASGTLALAAASLKGTVLGQAALPGRSTSERLLPAISGLLEQQTLPLHALSAIAIAHGPGSFTGIRVGLSAAKGLCEALQIPLIAISRLAVLAGKSSAPEALALLDAGRGEFYCGHYLEGSRVRESLVTREESLALLRLHPPARLVLCEDSVAAAFSNENMERVDDLSALDLVPQALHRFSRREFDDIAALDANYVRRTDLEIFAKQVRHAHPTP